MLTIFAAAVAVPVAVPFLIFTAEMLAGLKRPPFYPAGDNVPRTVVLMPAHDEAMVIGKAIAALTGARRRGLELLVIADNCSDNTAAIARAAGCRVTERHDPTRRGKGFALAAGRDSLMDDPPACVIVLDADCTVAEDGLQRLALACVATDAPIQSAYLFRPVAEAPPSTKVSNFAFLVKNLVRQQGSTRLGAIALLTGTGMAIPWADFCEAPLASDDLVEDLALGIWLARRGRPPRFAADVTTWSDSASGLDLMVQRRRWEHGFLKTAGGRVLPLLAEGLRRRSRNLVWLGLHLMVPPLALLAALGVVALMLTVLFALAGATWLVPGLLILVFASAGASVMAAWIRYGREYAEGRALFAIPAYVFSKLPIYRSLAGRGPSHWQRTRRAGESNAPKR